MKTSITDGRTCSRSPPPTASLNSVSPVKQTISLTTKESPSSEWPGVSSARDDEAAGFEVALDDLEPEALHELVVAGDVIRMRVRREEMRDRQPLLLRRANQRLERRAAVDEDRGASRLVADEVGVREPLGMHAAVDEHRRVRLLANPRMEVRCPA